MFRRMCLTKQGRLFKHFLTSFICFRPSLVVKGLPMCNFNCEPCFCQIFWQFGTEFLCLAKLSSQGGTPYNGLYGEATLERSTFFRLQVYQRVGSLLNELYKKVEKSVIWVCDRAQRANRWMLWLYKVRKTLYFCDWFLFKWQCIYSS